MKNSPPTTFIYYIKLHYYLNFYIMPRTYSFESGDTRSGLVVRVKNMIPILRPSKVSLTYRFSGESQYHTFSTISPVRGPTTLWGVVTIQLWKARFTAGWLNQSSMSLSPDNTIEVLPIHSGRLQSMRYIFNSWIWGLAVANPIRGTELALELELELLVICDDILSNNRDLIDTGTLFGIWCLSYLRQANFQIFL